MGYSVDNAIKSYKKYGKNILTNLSNELIIYSDKFNKEANKNDICLNAFLADAIYKSELYKNFFDKQKINVSNLTDEQKLLLVLNFYDKSISAFLDCIKTALKEDEKFNAQNFVNVVADIYSDEGADAIQTIADKKVHFASIVKTLEESIKIDENIDIKMNGTNIIKRKRK